jgi:hypothetical protein
MYFRFVLYFFGKCTLGWIIIHHNVYLPKEHCRAKHIVYAHLTVICSQRTSTECIVGFPLQLCFRKFDRILHVWSDKLQNDDFYSSKSLKRVACKLFFSTFFFHSNHGGRTFKTHRLFPHASYSLGVDTGRDRRFQVVLFFFMCQISNHVQRHYLIFG